MATADLIVAPGESSRFPLVRRSLPRLGRMTLALVLVLFLIGLFSHPGQVGMKTLAILPEVFPGAPVRPLPLVSSPPTHRELTWQSPAGRVDADLYTPARPGRYGGIVLFTGAFGLRRDVNLVRFAEALARCGAVVLVPESESLQRGDIRPDEIQVLVQSLEILRAEPSADTERIGLAGFSVGATLALLAAEDPRGSELARYVSAMGGYFDARSTLVAVASGTIVVDDVPMTWQPDQVTRYTFNKHLIEALPSERDRKVLGAAFLDKDGEAKDSIAGQVSDEGAIVLELLSGTTRDRAVELVAALPSGAQTWLDDVSPSQNIAGLRPALYVMHDQSDVFIPFTESRELVAAVPSGNLQQYTESQLFAHVTPEHDLPLHIFAMELSKLFWHLWLVAMEFL
jgi:acetyl esterase/lipase